MAAAIIVILLLVSRRCVHGFVAPLVRVIGATSVLSHQSVGVMLVREINAEIQNSLGVIVLVLTSVIMTLTVGAFPTVLAKIVDQMGVEEAVGTVDIVRRVQGESALTARVIIPTAVVKAATAALAAAISARSLLTSVGGMVNVASLTVPANNVVRMAVEEAVGVVDIVRRALTISVFTVRATILTTVVRVATAVLVPHLLARNQPTNAIPNPIAVSVVLGLIMFVEAGPAPVSRCTKQEVVIQQVVTARINA